MKVLVTGGAGFIGSNLCRRLVSEGADVTVLDDLSTGLRTNLDGLPVELVVGTILDLGLLNTLASTTDKIIHLAARGSVPRSIADPQATFAVNAQGTLNVLEAARASRPLTIVASSSSVYGSNDATPKGELDWTAPLSPYAASKSATEGFAHAYARSYGLPVTTFRFFNVFGPWQRADHPYAAVIPKWIDRVLKGLPIEIHGDGEQSRDFTLVDTVVDVLCAAIDRNVVHASPVNLAYGNQICLNELVRELESLIGPLSGVVRDLARPGDIRHSMNNPKLLHALFPEISPVPFSEGLAKTIHWMKEIAP